MPREYFDMKLYLKAINYNKNTCNYKLSLISQVFCSTLYFTRLLYTTILSQAG